jgi:Uma2 family endonuclease
MQGEWRAGARGASATSPAQLVPDEDLLRWNASRIPLAPLDQLRRTVPPLENGDRLTRVEFERRYDVMPGNVKAELIDGVVYMTSPTKNPHGDVHGIVDTWLGVYAARTPGCRAPSNVTLRLDELDEAQPDAVLRLLPEAGGRSREDEEGFLTGSVELVVEVAVSSAARDLHQK